MVSCLLLVGIKASRVVVMGIETCRNPDPSLLFANSSSSRQRRTVTSSLPSTLSVHLYDSSILNRITPPNSNITARVPPPGKMMSLERVLELLRLNAKVLKEDMPAR